MNDLTNHPYVNQLKHNQTPEEHQFFRILQKCILDNFPGFQTCISKQVPIRHPFGFYILDFWIGPLRLAFEIDGGYHWQDKQLDKDLKRDSFLEKQGIRVHHIPNDSIIREDRRKKFITDLPFLIAARISHRIQWERTHKDWKYSHRKTPKKTKKYLNPRLPVAI